MFGIKKQRCNVQCSIFNVQFYFNNQNAYMRKLTLQDKAPPVENALFLLLISTVIIFS